MTKKILIVNATFYRDISSDILLSAEKTLKANGYVSETIEVPGSFEIPAVISGFSKKYIGFGIKYIIKNVSILFLREISEETFHISGISLRHFCIFSLFHSFGLFHNVASCKK